MFLGHDLGFWLAVAGAAVFKLLTSPSLSPVRALATVTAALFAAIIFTDPVLNWLALDPLQYKTPIAALIALTGEGLLRSIVSITSSPEKLIDTFKAILGRK